MPRGYEFDLYSLRDAEPFSSKSRADLIESDVLGPIDDRGALVLERLLTTSPSQLTQDETEHWAIFINSLLERHPQRILENNRLAESHAKSTLESMRENWGPPLPGRPDILDIVDVANFTRNLSREQLARELRNPETVDYLKGFTMVRVDLHREQDLSLVSGENPVLVNCGGPWPIRFFTLALTPTSLLYGQNGPHLLSIDTIVRLCILHGFQLFRQCQFIYSREPLADLAGLKMRSAVRTLLIRSSWKGTQAMA